MTDLDDTLTAFFGSDLDDETVAALAGYLDAHAGRGGGPDSRRAVHLPARRMLTILSLKVGGCPPWRVVVGSKVVVSHAGVSQQHGQEAADALVAPRRPPTMTGPGALPPRRATRREGRRVPRPG
jgi:hypothetical protein